MAPTDVRADSLKPAEYNPRVMTDESRRRLKESICQIGLVIPIIANDGDMTIIAGHQRVRACIDLGIEFVPAMLVKGITKGDEMSFNQLHNGVESGSVGSITADDIVDPGWCEVKPSRFDVVGHLDAVRVASIARLLMKYGNVMSTVVCDGVVMWMPEYVKACQVTGNNVNCNVIDRTLAEKCRTLLSAEYGRYSYSDLKKDTYVQGLAQLHRDPYADGHRARKSLTYEQLVIPWSKRNPSASMLDFGCGRGAYVDMLSDDGIDIDGLEFYNNDSQSIDVSKGNRQIDEIVSHLENDGLYDCVICDSVLNSVDCKLAEDSVLGCINAFLPIGGVAFISGRPVDDAENHMRASTCRSDKKNFISFLDDDGYTASYRRGHWYYQHYHTKTEAVSVIERHGLRVDKFLRDGCSWRAQCTKVKNESYEDYVRYEFTLPLPNGRRYERCDDVLSAIGLASGGAS